MAPPMHLSVEQIAYQNLQSTLQIIFLKEKFIKKY